MSGCAACTTYPNVRRPPPTRVHNHATDSLSQHACSAITSPSSPGPHVGETSSASRSALAVAGAVGALPSSIVCTAQAVQQPGALQAHIRAHAAAVVRVLGETAIVAMALATHRVVRLECFPGAARGEAGELERRMVVMVGAYYVVYVQLLVVQALEAACVRRRRWILSHACTIS